jgi:hypothetical protein
MDVCDEGVTLARLLEEYLLAENPTDFEGVRLMRETQEVLPSGNIEAIDASVTAIEAVSHSLRIRTRLQGGPEYDVALRLHERVQAWEKLVREAEELNG